MIYWDNTIYTIKTATPTTTTPAQETPSVWTQPVVLRYTRTQQAQWERYDDLHPTMDPRR